MHFDAASRRRAGVVRLRASVSGERERQFAGKTPAAKGGFTEFSARERLRNRADTPIQDVMKHHGPPNGS